MHEEQLRVLKVMNEATGHLDFTEFANMAGLPPSEAMTALRELAKTGHLRKVGGGYGLTDTGKSTLRALVPVPAGTEFQFYFEIGKPTGDCAATPIEFFEIIQRIDVSSLEFHFFRGDFKNWAYAVLNNPPFAEQLASNDEKSLSGQALRDAILKALESAYNLP